MTMDTAYGSGDELAAIEAELAAHGHGRVPRSLRHRHILAVAERLFVDRGYGAASMDELAARAGVSKPVIYDLFGSKDEVFAACMSRAADQLAADVATAVAGATTGDDAERLRAGALAWFRFIDARRDLWFALLTSGDTPASAAIDAVRARQDAFVAAQLAAMAAERGVDVDPVWIEAVAALVNGAFEAVGRWWGGHPDRSAEELAELYTTVLLPGLAALQHWGSGD